MSRPSLMTFTAPSPTDPRLSSLPAPLPPPEISPDLLDLDSLKVVARLRRHGHAAYLVGGCVRDLLCGAHPKDYDVATSAHPEEIRDVFRNSRLIGRRFRLAHVFFPGGRFVEVATFRATPVQAAEDTSLPTEEVDLLLTDDNLFGSAEEDAKRRDFTINGLFYDVHDGRVIDYVGGRADLEAKLVRTIGDPEIRLREDPVRGLRAARIAAKLNFTIEPDTFAAMRRHADELPRCAPARVLEETLKLLRSGASCEAFRILREARILRVLLPPVEEVLEAGGPAMARRFSVRLSALDELVKTGEAVSDAVMLATLLAFLPLQHRPEEGPEGAGFDEEPAVPHGTVPSADKVLSQMSAHARLPRRVADRVRAIIAAQKLFLASPKKKRRRGGAGFVRTPHFAEALQLFEVEVRATGQHKDALERWKLKAAEDAALVRKHGEEAPEEGEHDEEGPEEAEAAAPPVEAAPAPEAAPAATPDPNAPAKKRRRRGGRRHRRGKGGEAPDDGTPPPPAENT